MREPTPAVSVIIPCYNEEKNLERGVLDEVDRYMRQQSYPWKAIADDGSTDGSLSLVERYVAGKEEWSLAALPHGGKPSALWGGLQAADCEAVLLTDMDQSTPIYELEKLLHWYNEGYTDVVRLPAGEMALARKGTARDPRLAKFMTLSRKRV